MQLETDTRWPSKQHYEVAVKWSVSGWSTIDNDDINCRKFVYGLIVDRKAVAAASTAAKHARHSTKSILRQSSGQL